MNYLSLSDTLLGRILTEAADVFLLAVILYIGYYIRESIRMRRGKAAPYQEPDNFDFYRDMHAASTYDTIRGFSNFMMLCNALIAGIGYAVKGLAALELISGNVILGHLIWGLSFGVLSFIMERKLTKTAKQDMKTDKVLSGIYEYLRSLTDVPSAKRIMSLVCEVMDNSRNPEKLFALIDEVAASDKPGIELGEYSVKAIMTDFMQPETGASGWFKLSDFGKKTYAEYSRLVGSD